MYYNRYDIKFKTRRKQFICIEGHFLEMVKDNLHETPNLQVSSEKVKNSVDTIDIKV